MLLIFEILFALWIVSELCFIILGCGMLLLAVITHLASFILTGLAVAADLFCRLWRTAFYD